MPSSPQQPPRRALLTGVAGLIGSNLARQMLAAGWEVVGIDDFSSGWRERLPTAERFHSIEGDVGEPGLLEDVLRASEPFDAIVHLAARVGVRAVLRDPEGCRDSNLRGVRAIARVLASAEGGRGPRVYAASTSEVYAASERPLAEGDATRCTQAGGRWAYAASKLRGEELLDAASMRLAPGRRPVHLRFFNVVGPGQDADSGMVLASFVEQALAGIDLTVHGDGSAVRTFGHVDEITSSLLEVIELGSRTPTTLDLQGPLNLGGAARTTIRQLADLVIRSAASSSQVRNTNPLLDIGHNFEGIAFRAPDLTRLASLGVSLPKADLETIVRDTLERHPSEARPLRVTTACVSPAS